jgi:hypothetical protein
MNIGPLSPGEGGVRWINNDIKSGNIKKVSN